MSLSNIQTPTCAMAVPIDAARMPIVPMEPTACEAKPTVPTSTQVVPTCTYVHGGVTTGLHHLWWQCRLR
jgi:hypothetical protein